MHLTWSRESAEGRCPDCGSHTILATSLATWEIHSDDDEIDGDGVEVDEEVSGHFCRECGKLTSLSLNT